MIVNSDGQELEEYVNQTVKPMKSMMEKDATVSPDMVKIQEPVDNAQQELQ